MIGNRSSWLGRKSGKDKRVRVGKWVDETSIDTVNNARHRNLS